ncbi:TPA: site-specific integrase [Pseudomonas aeruginosa]|nr:site-specific integrase [Pseudomonas aeruginosa]
MALIAQPFRHPDSGIYYLRRRVPDDLRPIIGKTEIRRSLNTRNHQQAKAAFAIAYAESERTFSEARNGLYNPSKQREPVTPPSPAPEAPITLSEALQRYVDSLPLSGKPDHVLRRHKVDYSRAVNRFIKYLGDCALTAIQPADIHRFAGALINPIDPRECPLATSSARLLLARLSSVLAFSVDASLLKSNPVVASRIHKRLGSGKPKRNLGHDKGYSWKELVTLFRQPAYQQQRNAEGRPGNSVFWIPLIAAYTGARREEIAQLYVADVIQHETGQWFIRIIDDRPDKSLKTDSSRRDVPLHDDLIELGILDLIRGRTTDSRVFPHLVKVSDGYAGIVSKAWRPLTQQCGVYRAGRHPLHAFRHTFKTLAREHGIPKEVSDWITGHASGGVGDAYGITPLSRMAAEMKKLPSIARAAGLLPTP